MGYNVLDGVYYRIKATAGFCTPNMGQLTEYLEKAEQYAKRAKQASDFASLHPGMPAELDKATQAIGEIHKKISAMSNLATDVGAICQMSEAISVLNKWAEGKKDNAAAAAAFDSLFGGLSRFVSKLPPPINAYSKLLDEIALVKFFSRMQRIGASRVGENTSTPTGKTMKEILDGMDNEFRPNR